MNCLEQSYSCFVRKTLETVLISETTQDLQVLFKLLNCLKIYKEQI